MIYIYIDIDIDIDIYGVEKSIGKSNFLLFLMEGIVHETGIVLIEKATEKRNS